MTRTRNYPPVMQQMLQQKQMSGAAVADAATAPSSITINVPASPPAEGAVNPATGKVFTEEELNAAREAARTEEKNKLYPRIDELKAQVEEFNAFKAEIEAERAAKLQAEEDERKRREQEEMDTRQLLQTKEQEWEQKFNAINEEWSQRFQAIQEERDAQAALLERERQFQALQAYRQQKLQEHANDIHPALHAYITGDSQEAIDASIQSAIESSSAILAEVQQVVGHKPRPIQTFGTPASGPTETLEQTVTFTKEDIQNMNMADYAKYRDMLLPAAAKTRHHR